MSSSDGSLGSAPLTLARLDGVVSSHCRFSTHSSEMSSSTGGPSSTASSTGGLGSSWARGCPSAKFVGGISGGLGRAPLGHALPDGVVSSHCRFSTHHPLCERRLTELDEVRLAEELSEPRRHRSRGERSPIKSGMLSQRPTQHDTVGRDGRSPTQSGMLSQRPA